MKPKLRFNEYSDEYTLSELEKYLIQYKKTTDSNNQYPVLTSSRSGIFFQEDYFNRQVASKDNTGYNVVPRNYFTYRHMSDDTIFSFNINTLCDYGIVSTLYPVFTTTNEMNSNYLKEYLNNSKRFSEYCLLQKQGGSRTYMYFDKLKKFVGCFPSIHEQTKVSNFLSLLDKKIELQSRKIEDLKLFKKGLFHKLFDEIDGNNYLLSDITNFENGKGHENIIDDDGNYILINSKFISTDGNVIKKCSKQLTPLFKDDITMVMSDLPNGKALAKCYYIEEDNKYSLNQRICKIHIKNDKIINSKYLFYLLNRNPYYLKFDDGVNQTNLKKDDILNININIPSKDIQDKNSKILTTTDNIINKESIKLSKLETLKKGLMQNMFV